MRIIEEKFRDLLESYNVTECYTTPLMFTCDSELNGIIRVNVNSNELIDKLYELLSNHERCGKKQWLIIGSFSERENLRPNYDLNGEIKERNEREFRELLKKYNVSKCYLNRSIDFGSQWISGDVYVDKEDYQLFDEVWNLFYNNDLEESPSVMVQVIKDGMDVSKLTEFDVNKE
jgi:hypothetical protein